MNSFKTSMSSFAPIIPTYQVRDLSNLELQKLLNRLFQELDDQNTGLDEMEKVLHEIALRSNVDYKNWINKNTSVSLDKGLIFWDENSNINEKDILQNLQEEEHKDKLNEQKERTLLAVLISREKKLTKHYETVIVSYQELLQNIAIAARKRREDTFGIYLDEPTNESGKLRETLQATQIEVNMQERIQALNRNEELLKSFAKNKSVELRLAKSTIADETEKLNKSLEN